VDQRLYLTDLPGYGFTRTGQERRKELSALVDSYLTSGRPIALVLHLMDIRHEPSALDIQMIDWLEANAIPYRVILTKCDKLSRQQIQQQVQQITSQLDLAEDVGLIPFSAADRTGLLEIRALIAALSVKQL
jgi:GTP-binding protein